MNHFKISGLALTHLLSMHLLNCLNAYSLCIESVLGAGDNTTAVLLGTMDIGQSS